MRCVDGGDHGGRGVGEGARGIGFGGEDTGGVGKHGDELGARAIYIVILVAGCEDIGERGVGERLGPDPQFAKYAERVEVGAVASNNGAGERDERKMSVDSGRGEVVTPIDLLRRLPYFSVGYAILLV